MHRGGAATPNCPGCGSGSTRTFRRCPGQLGRGWNSLPPAHAHGRASTMSAREYQAGARCMFHVATVTAAVATRPSAPSDRMSHGMAWRQPGCDVAPNHAIEAAVHEDRDDKQPRAVQGPAWEHPHPLQHEVGSVRQDDDGNHSGGHRSDTPQDVRIHSCTSLLDLGASAPSWRRRSRSAILDVLWHGGRICITCERITDREATTDGVPPEPAGGGTPRLDVRGDCSGGIMPGTGALRLL